MRQDIVRRAKSAMGHDTIYALGTGGRKPGAVLPYDTARRCDCSGFAAWTCELDRYQPGNPVLKEINGGWLSTDGIIRLARASGGLFELIEIPDPGDIVVYGDSRKDGMKRQGHVGIVVSVPWGEDPTHPVFSPGIWELIRVVHCSSGNYKRTGDAIQETDAALFGRAKAIFVRSTHHMEAGS